MLTSEKYIKSKISKQKISTRLLLLEFENWRYNAKEVPEWNGSLSARP